MALPGQISPTQVEGNLPVEAIEVSAYKPGPFHILQRGNSRGALKPQQQGCGAPSTQKKTLTLLCHSGRDTTSKAGPLHP